MEQRINKLIATNLGLSRRESDQLVEQGQVKINGRTAKLGQKVGENDLVTIKGDLLEMSDLVYLALNKPRGYVSSRKSQDGTPTLYELLPSEYQNLKTVGRLDKDSEGLILLTNDGDFAFRMTHPRFHKEKIYEVRLERSLAPLHQQMLADFGVNLNDGLSRLGLESMSEDRKSWRVLMQEGRNRQIRRSFGALGYAVVKLKRVSFGRYELGGLEYGKWQLVPKIEN